MFVDALALASQRAAEVGLAGKLPAGFDSWFSRAVHRDPRARFQNAAALRRALEDEVFSAVVRDLAHGRTEPLIAATAQEPGDLALAGTVPGEVDKPVEATAAPAPTSPPLAAYHAGARIVPPKGPRR